MSKGRCLLGDTDGVARVRLAKRSSLTLECPLIRSSTTFEDQAMAWRQARNDEEQIGDDRR